MKKLLSLFLSVMLIFSLFPVAYAFSPGKYIVTENVAYAYFSPGENAEKVSEIPKNTYLDITEIRNNAFGKAFIAKDGIWGWVRMDSVKLITPLSANTDVKSIKIKNLPAKTTYVDGREELDLTGMKVVSIDSKNNETPVSGYSVYAPEMKTPGKKTVLITYSPDGVSVFETSFEAEVIRVPVKSISVVTPPKTQYLENQALDLSALTVKTEFQNEKENTVLSYSEIANNPDYIISSCHGESHGSTLSKGQHYFKITYKYSDIFCSFSVDVTPRKLISLSIKQQPDNLTVYDKTKIPAIDGLILEAAYDNGEKEDVYHYNCKAECDPSEFIIGPGNKVKVYFGDLFVVLSFRYSEAEPYKIVLEYPKDENGKPMPLIMPKGEEIDLSGIKVRLVYTDDTFEYVKDFTITEPDYKRVDASQNIIVKYKEFSEVFTIYIKSAFSKGDIDGDGKIRASDARQALRASVGLTTLSGDTFFAGDADRNGKISANDARLILRASVGLENIYITL